MFRGRCSYVILKTKVLAVTASGNFRADLGLEEVWALQIVVIYLGAL